MRLVYVLMIFLLALTPLSSESKETPSTTQSPKLDVSPMLTLTEAEYRATIKTAVDKAVAGAVEVALEDYEKRHGWETSLWRGAAIVAAGAAAGALLGDAPGMGWGAAGAGVLALAIEAGHRIFHWY